MRNVIYVACMIFLSLFMVVALLPNCENSVQENEPENVTSDVETVESNEISSGVFENYSVEDVVGVIRTTAAKSYYYGGASIEVTYALLSNGEIIKTLPFGKSGKGVRYPYTDEEAKFIILSKINGKLLD